MALPLQAENLQGLPPAYVITAEFDPLRDEGEAYVVRFRNDGVSVDLKRYPEMIHGFFSVGYAIDQGRLAIQDAGIALQAAFRHCKASPVWQCLIYVENKFTSSPTIQFYG